MTELAVVGWISGVLLGSGIAHAITVRHVRRQLAGAEKMIAALSVSLHTAETQIAEYRQQIKLHDLRVRARIAREREAAQRAGRVETTPAKASSAPPIGRYR